jgi:hypothetical protein
MSPHQVQRAAAAHARPSVWARARRRQFPPGAAAAASPDGAGVQGHPAGTRRRRRRREAQCSPGRCAGAADGARRRRRRARSRSWRHRRSAAGASARLIPPRLPLRRRRPLRGNHTLRRRRPAGTAAARRWRAAAGPRRAGGSLTPHPCERARGSAAAALCVVCEGRRGPQRDTACGGCAEVVAAVRSVCDLNGRATPRAPAVHLRVVICSCQGRAGDAAQQRTRHLLDIPARRPARTVWHR